MRVQDIPRLFPAVRCATEVNELLKTTDCTDFTDKNLKR